MKELLAQYHDVIAYSLAGVVALIGLGIVQIFRRRGDLKQARQSVRLVSHSIAPPRPGPVAISGSYHEVGGDRYIDAGGQHVVLDGAVEIMRGTSARWQGGVRTYNVRPGAQVVAIGVMAKAQDNAWRIVPSPEEPGVLVYATSPVAAPPPLFPWRALLILAICYGIGYGVVFGLDLVDRIAPFSE